MAAGTQSAVVHIIAVVPDMWLASYHIDGCYLKMLPGKRAEATAEEAAVLERIFGKNGELPAERLS